MTGKEMGAGKSSGVGVTDVDLHPVLLAAGRDGRLPDWVRASRERRRHLERVAGLMEEWARELEVPAEERIRWRAAALFHDALKEADAGELRELAGRDWPEPLLHGPACAERLRREGVSDEELVHAVTYHSVGHPEFGRLGDYLYLADYLEPGRPSRPDLRERLRLILPGERREAVLSVVALRIAHRLERRGGILTESVEYWNHRLAEVEEGG